MKTETFILPAYWASALVNNDYSGLRKQDVEEIETFLNTNELSKASCLGCSDTEHFSWYNDANTLGGDVLEYYFPAN